jgi:hypothetical protein
MSKILIGCDPEIFVKQGGSFVSAHGLIPGDKKNPHKVEKGAVQVDGMALEFNIDPAESEKQFVENVNTVLATLKAMVPQYELAPVPVADFALEYIASQPAEARELGCDPDFCAYRDGPNPRPDNQLPMRTASGHVHVGWTDFQDIHTAMADAKSKAAAKQLDIVLGLPSMFYDEDTRRRSMYGKGGCYRRKPYGMEYRTLSNAWLLTDERKAWVFRNAKKAMEMLFAGEALFLKTKGYDIEAIINNSDKSQAEKLIKRFDLEMVS